MRARRLLGEIADGKDPAAVRDAQRAVPSFKEFSERYLTEHAVPRKKPRSVEEDRRNLRLHIWPELAKRRLTDITDSDVARLHAKGKSRPANANRCLALLSHMFTSPRGGANDNEAQTRALISINTLNAPASAYSLRKNSLALVTRCDWQQ